MNGATGDDEALGGCIQRDWAKGLFVLREIVCKHVLQRLGLLRAQVNALEVRNLDLVGRGLRVSVDGSEDKKEIPDGEPDLHRVGIGIAVVGCLGEGDLGVVRLGDGLAHGAGILKGNLLIILWCGRGDLNPHALRHRLLRPACLPFHHPRGLN